MVLTSVGEGVLSPCRGQNLAKDQHWRPALVWLQNRGEHRLLSATLLVSHLCCLRVAEAQAADGMTEG